MEGGSGSNCKANTEYLCDTFGLAFVFLYLCFRIFVYFCICAIKLQSKHRIFVRYLRISIYICVFVSGSFDFALSCMAITTILLNCFYPAFILFLQEEDSQQKSEEKVISTRSFFLDSIAVSLFTNTVRRGALSTKFQ